MAKQTSKYFIAVVPEGTIQEEVSYIKKQLQENFNLKYAQKSPAHITLKMPFNWNEEKEDVLIQKLREFLSTCSPLHLKTSGFDSFGKRVLFIRILKSEKLNQLQRSVSKFCKQFLNQVEELSDRNFHAHMTVAFKDVKEKDFASYTGFVKQLDAVFSMEVRQIGLLKKIGGKWILLCQLPLGPQSQE
jgi:2'-5' RNA ligase